MPPEVLAFIRANADEYRRCARITNCRVKYPAGNRCARCQRDSAHPLVPHRHGWECRTCAYPNERVGRDVTAEGGPQHTRPSRGSSS